MTEIEQLLTIAQVSEILNVSRATIYRLMETGELKPLRIRARSRFEAEEVRRYLQQRREVNQ